MKEQTKTSWKIDAGHSEVQFKVKHLAIANISGTFNKFEGTVQSYNDTFEDAQVDLAMEVDSLTTNNTERDKHLKSAIFFDEEHFPKLSFSGQLEKEDNAYVLNGDLTIRDICKKVKFAVEFNGIGTGRFGDTRAGFELSGQINRKDFDLTWNLITEAGGLVVGEDIKLHADIELVKE